MEKISLIGIDIAKEVFQIHAVGKDRKGIMKRKLYRSDMGLFFRNLSPCVIAMESCGGSHYWARELEGYGHTVKLIDAYFVKSYVHGHKNNSIDAEAIVEAASSPRVKFVAANSIESQDLQMKHRIRERLKASRVAIANELYGFLLEYGVVIPKGMKRIRANVVEAMEKVGDKVSAEGRRLITNLCEELQQIDQRFVSFTKELEQLAKSHDVARRLCTIPGIAAISATALIAKVGDAKRFKNGRHFAAWLGLVPLQNSTGDNAKLGRITKHGDPYIRSLLAEGAGACVTALRFYKDNCPKRIMWMKELLARRGRQKTVIATANKNARIAWAIMSSESAVYDPNFQRMSA